MSHKYVVARLPGAGNQREVTEAVEMPNAQVINSTHKAVHLTLPYVLVPDVWIARSQLCDGGDINSTSNIGDSGSVRIPLFIVRKWAKERKQ